MGSNKPKPAKLSVYAACLICAFNLLLPADSKGSAYFTIQTTAPENVENLRSTSGYAPEIVPETAIADVSPQMLAMVSGNQEQPVGSKTEEQSESPEKTAAPSDSVTSKSQKSYDENKQASKTPEKSKRVVNAFILWIYGQKDVFELKRALISYAQNFPQFTRKYYILLIEKTYDHPIVPIFIFLILVFMANGLVVLLILYLTNKQKNQRERYVSIYRNLYEDILRSYLFGEIEWEKALPKFKKLKNPLNRKILTSVLLNFKENLRGEMDTQIPEIFVRLGLNTDSVQLAESSFYAKKVQGIRELTNLYPEGAMAIIPSYINHPHDLVRTESQVSYIRLNPEKPFEFLKTLTSPFPRWTQLSAFYLLRLHQLPVPAFVDYLDSKQPTVRNFCLRMIVFFQQLENASQIFKMLESPQEMTRFLAIKAVNDLRLFDGKKLIKEMYPAETGKNKIEIIKALEKIGNEEDFDFLESIIRTGSVTLKTEACRSLYFMNKEGQERLTLLSQNTDLQIDQYLAHITDPRN